MVLKPKDTKSLRSKKYEKISDDYYYNYMYTNIFNRTINCYPCVCVGEKVVYYTNISKPNKLTKNATNKNGTTVVDMGPEIIDLSIIWVQFFDGRNFKLPSNRHKFFAELAKQSKKDGVEITRYSDNILKVKCVIKMSECIANEKASQEEFALTKLFKKYFNKELRYSFYGPGNSEIISIWETKSADRLMVVSTDKTISPSINIEIVTSADNKITTLFYQIEFPYNNKVGVELIEMKKFPDGNIEITDCEYFEQTKDREPIFGQNSQLKKLFGEFLPDLPDKVKPFFSSNVLQEIENCGQ